MGYLYRGVSKKLDELNNGELKPKGNKSELTMKVGDAESVVGEFDIGNSEKNAVRYHHNKSGKNDGCYISTTKDMQQAINFATNEGNCDGYVYKIDTSKFDKYEVVQYDLSNKKFPEEQEVSLRAKNCGVLPQEIIVKKTSVKATEYSVNKIY